MSASLYFEDLTKSTRNRTGNSFLRLFGSVLISCLVGTIGGYFAEKASAKEEKATAKDVVERPCQETRPLTLVHKGRWIGQAICYSPYREGQRPGGPGPTKEQLREDLRILAKHWPVLRTYSSTEFVENMLEVIREEKLALHVMMGAWIEPEIETVDGKEKRNESARQANLQQVHKLIELANEYEELVIAVIVGNETQVEWSSHKVRLNRLIEYLRQARSETRVPVTTADDFLFWAKASSSSIVDEVDFIMAHIHPVWHAQEAENAQAFVREKYEQVSKTHPDSYVVIGETGWATQKHAEGRETEFVRGKMGEEEQQIACQQIVDWSKTNGVATFLFEAFDEPWKGADHPDATNHPDQVEKHWGLFRVDRTPKKFMNNAR